MVFNDTIIRAISWTLIHSIWQGILLAVCAGVVILRTKKAVAASRYNLLSALFIIFLFTVGLTFNYELNPAGSDTVTRLNLSIVNNQYTELNSLATTDFSNILIDFLNNNANYITMIWMLVFGFKILGIFNAFNTVYRIRSYKTFAPSVYWKNRISELALLINIKKPIVLLESALVKIPCVTGFFKPIILVPVGLLSNLPQDQIEAILLHELAHIRRKDYGVNLLQHLAEMLFFFNPALLWLSSLIRDERENCCDDIALNIIGNKKDLVHALISFEEFNNENLAVAFAGKKKHLFFRVKRIIYNDNKSLNSVEKIFLSLSLLFVFIVTIAFSKPEITNVSQSKDEKNPTERTQVTTTTETTQTIEEITNSQKEETEIPEIQTDATLNEPDYDVPNVNEQIPACAPAPHIATPENVQSFKTDSTKSKTVTTSITTTTKTVSNSEKSDKNSGLKIDISIENPVKDLNVDVLTSNIISDLIKENIIDTTQEISYRLSHKSLVVNGIKQSQKVHAKLKKYVKSKMSAICYNYEYNGDIY